MWGQRQTPIRRPNSLLLCSRHNPAFLQRTGSGSHLYSANLHTLRSRTLSSRTYPTLVGLATLLLPCFPHLHPYYSTRMGICQGVFKSFLKLFFNQHHSLAHCVPLVDSLVTGVSRLSFPLDTISIPHLGRFVKGFGRKSFFIFFEKTLDKLYRDVI